MARDEQPLDWTKGAGRPRHPPPDAVDIIIPIYGAADALERCLASVKRQTDLGRHRLVLVVDGPQPRAVEEAIADAGIGEIVRGGRRRGFTGSVNRGIECSSGDVVLLNSDTVVTPRWLEQLIEAAASSGDIGTVTPLSNNATLCSVPRGFEENLIPGGFDATSFAELVRAVSIREYPRLPTGVGVCLYVRRALLNDVGVFDETNFPRGYGEENDFCMRALARGWIHVADDATFIEHEGGRSFGPSAAALRKRAARTLRRLHPKYFPMIAEFMRRDPLRSVRERIRSFLAPPVPAPRGPRRVTHIVHGWPPMQQAGSELYARRLVEWQRQHREVSVFTRMADPSRRQASAVEKIDGGVRVRLVTNNFEQRDPLARNAMRDHRFERELARFLDEERPELVHIHHLSGHAMSLASIVRRHRIPIVHQIQDWWSLCARVNLCDAAWRRCSGPAISKCARCAPLTGIAPAPFWNRALHLARNRFARSALKTADACVMGSQFIRDDYVQRGLFSPNALLFVLPYGVHMVPQPKRQRTFPLRFGFIGSILPHKGLHIAATAFGNIDSSLAELHAWGDFSLSGAYTSTLRELGGSSLILEGPFAEEDRERILASIDALVVPSVGLESFGLAARESLRCGVPVIAVKDGALTELFADGDGGTFFPNGDSAALEAIIRGVIDHPERLEEWSARIASVKTAEEHAMEIEMVYERVLARRR